MEINNKKPDLRERVFARGLSYPSDEELLMLILGSGTKSDPVESLAFKIKNVVDFSARQNLIDNLMQIPGVGLGKALSIAAAVEFGRRKSALLQRHIKTPSEIVPYIKHYGFKPVEHFITVSLSGAHEVVDTKVVAVGGSNSAIISPREVFFEASKSHASSIIIVHNHPDGSCTPSEADIETTEHICAAGEILGISLLDHIILCRESYFSFREHGMIH